MSQGESLQGLHRDGGTPLSARKGQDDIRKVLLKVLQPSWPLDQLRQLLASVVRNRTMSADFADCPAIESGGSA